MRTKKEIKQAIKEIDKIIKYLEQRKVDKKAIDLMYCQKGNLEWVLNE